MPTTHQTRLAQLGLTVNDLLMDRALRHQVFVNRLASYEANRVVNFIDSKVMPDLYGRLARRLDVIARHGFDTGPVTTARLKKMTTEIGISLTKGFGDVRKEFGEGLLAAGKHEAAIEADALSKAVMPLKNIAPMLIETTLPSAGLLREIVYRRPFQGRLLKDWFGGIAKGVQTAVTDQVKIGLIEGDSLGQIMTRVRGTGAIPGVGRAAKRQALSVVRTAVTHVTTQAREATYEANKHLMNGVRWVSVLDAKVTDICLTRDSNVYAIGKGPRPPAHISCLPGDVLVLARGGISGASKRRFDGEVVIIRTASGREITCTPHHPVLTNRGWIHAQTIDLGSQVFCDSRSQVEAGPSAVDHNHEHVPAAIHDVAESFLADGKVMSVEVPTSAPDFHGDGGESEVAVVGSNRFLRNSDETKGVQHFGQLEFGLRRFREGPFSGLGALDSLSHRGLAPSGSNVGVASQRSLSSDGEVVHSGLLLLTPIAEIDSMFAQDAADGGWADVEEFCDPSDADSLGVFLDDVVFVDRRQFCGHVYNLETETGTYFGGGILTHNCRSTTSPAVKTLHELGLTKKQFKATDPGQRAAFGSSGPAPVPRGLTGEQFLRRQSNEFQAEVLGKGRAALFRRGKVSFDRFVDRRGRPMSLANLRAIEERIEAAAG